MPESKNDRNISITRTFEIDAGHRLQNHESKCRNAHGHRYKFEVVVRAEQLDGIGRVVDFGCLKSNLGQWLDDNWDHAFIAQAGDPIVEWLIANDQKWYLVNFPPTAENLARLFFEVASARLPKELKLEKVIVWETPSCKAEFSL